MDCNIFILGVDIGTTTVSGVLINAESGKIVASHAHTHEAEACGLPYGRHEQLPDKLMESVRIVVSQISSQHPVAHIIFTGQMHSVMVVDSQLKPLTNLITWRDRRTAEVPENIRRHCYAPETGCHLHPGYGALTLHYMCTQKTLPAAAHKVLTIQGYAQALLTGKCLIDETSAAGLGIWDVRHGKWHEDLVEAIGVPHTLLPKYMPSAEPCGYVSESSGQLSGATVYSSMGDNQAGVIGVSGLKATEVVINVGTSGQVSLPRSGYVFDPGLETRPMPGGGYLQVLATLCGGWAYQYLADFMRQTVLELTGVKLERRETLEMMDKIASDGHADGLHVLPTFAGTRSDEAVQTGVIYGVTTHNFTPQNLIHAFADGIANELAGSFDFTGLNGIAAIGNGVYLNRVLKLAIERRFGTTCRLSVVQEIAAYGAARAVWETRLQEKG